MRAAQKIRELHEGPVDRVKEHFELRYESQVKFESDWSDWVPVALVGPPKASIVNVQFLIEPGDPKNSKAVDAVRKELQFYLFDLRERDPWSYAKYHCGTGANIYSNVHWGYIEGWSRGLAADPKPSPNMRPELPIKLLVDGKRMLFMPESKQKRSAPLENSLRITRRKVSAKEVHPLPPRPQLECPECEFKSGNPDSLANHLIEIHSYNVSKAWLVAGEENERLYPKFRAPEGNFCVLGVNIAQSRGEIIATCADLKEAIAAAVRAAGTWPEIYVRDDSGKELYAFPSKPTNEKVTLAKKKQHSLFDEELKSIQEVGSEDDKKPTEEPTPQVERPERVRITTIPIYRPKKK